MQNENGVLAVQEDFGNALVDKYAPVWDKKYRSKGESIWVFQRRTLSSEDGADDIVYHKRVSDNKTTYYFGQGSEVSTEYDEHGNMTKQQGKDATMGNFEQTFENTYDDNGNLVSMKSTYNGDDGYFIDYIYAALNDASYNGEGTLLFDAATDTPSAA